MYERHFDKAGEARAPRRVGGEGTELEDNMSNDLVEEIGQLEFKLQAVDLPRKERNHLDRKLELSRSRLDRLISGDFGRRIPKYIAGQVLERDNQRDFGRPSHLCHRPGPPHHIRHFETFTGSHTRENPHTVENLEAPCADCHQLAHAMQIPSGISIETFFRSIVPEKWYDIERFWLEHNTAKLKGAT